MNPSFAFRESNPFSTKCTSPGKVNYRFSASASGGSAHTVNTHLELLLQTLKASSRAAVVGPHGTGKSTLLHTFLPLLQKSYPKVAFHQLNNDPTLGFLKRFKERVGASKRIRKELYELPAGGLLVIDGWEQLSWLARRRVVGSSIGHRLTLLVTCHRRLPGWTLLHETKASPELIRWLAKDLLSDSPHTIKKLIDEKLKARKLDPATNVRELWFDMYDVIEDSQSQSTRRN